MKQKALQYLNKGWNILPLKVGGKAPAIKWEEYSKALVQEGDVERWWSQNPSYNVGLVTGQVSGVVVLDIDGQEGTQILKDMFKDDITALRTLTSRTGRADGAGLHLFFKHPMDRMIPNRVRLLHGIDVRADGGIIVLPPSVHESGEEYRWVTEMEMKPFPEKLLHLLESDQATGVAKDDWSVTLEHGQRDSELTRRVGKLIYAGLPAKEIVSMMQAWNESHCNPPLPKSQVCKIVESIARKDASKAESAKVEEEGKGPRFKVLDFATAVRAYGEGEEKWAIPYWLPEETVGMFVAPPGSYKTWLLLCLAVSIATGRRFLNQFEVLPDAVGPVLIIQQEDPLPTLFNRISRVLGVGKVEHLGNDFIVPKTPAMPQIYWHTDQMFHLRDEKVMTEFCGILETLRPKLVLIDPLYSITAADDFMAGGAQDLLKLKTLRNKLGCSFLIAHHTSKVGREGRERAWGSQFLNAWMETGWQIKKIDDTNVSIGRHFKHHAPPGNVVLDFNIGDYSIDVLIKNEADAIRRVVEDTLSGKNVKSQRQAAEQLGLGSVGEVNKVFEKLGVKKKDGIYQLPEDK